MFTLDSFFKLRKGSSRLVQDTFVVKTYAIYNPPQLPHIVKLYFILLEEGLDKI